MKKLYVIGNGFDRWHNLPTSYSDFSEFADKELTEFENYYSFDDLHNYEPWHDFENALSAFDADIFLDTFNEVNVQSDDFKPSQVYGLEDEIAQQTREHISDVQSTFAGWIRQIDVSKTSPKMTFEQESQFITFNYTSTLQTVYGVDDSCVFHIHGRADKDANEDLIFGHGEDVQELPEVDEDGEPTGDIFSEALSAARYPLYALKKPVDEILERYKTYFDGLRNIEEVVIIGHSLNNIDIPYFRRIAEVATSANWTVTYHDETDKPIFMQTLVDCGIAEDKIKAIDTQEL